MIALSAAVCLSACSEDKGNYDYTDVAEVYVEDGEVLERSVNQYDYLDIVPNLKFTQGADESRFSYRWVIYLDAWSRDDSEAEEISTERNLHYLVSQAPDSQNAYAVVLYCTDKENGTVSQIDYLVRVNALISSGIMALYETADGCDFDYIATPYAVPSLTSTNRLERTYETSNGRKLAGSPKLIALARENGFAASSKVNRVYVATDREMVQLAGVDFTQEAGFDELFYSTPSTWNPLSITRFGQFQRITVMMNGDELRCINNNGSSPRFTYEFSDPVESPSALGEVRLAPYTYFSDATTPVSKNVVMYDKAGKRFVRIEAASQGTFLSAFPAQGAEAAFDVNYIGKDCRWFGKGYNTYGYALFTDGASQELYVGDFGMPEGTYGYDADWNYIFTPNPDVDKIGKAIYNLSAMPEIADATFFDCGQYGPVFMYATNRNIYACSLGSIPSAMQINEDFPVGEEITAMMIYNPSTYIMSSLADVAGTLLYVATWNGTEGKVYEFAITRNTCEMNNTTAGGSNRKAPLNVFGGMGKVVSMCMKLEGTGVQ